MSILTAFVNWLKALFTASVEPASSVTPSPVPAPVVNLTPAPAPSPDPMVAKVAAAILKHNNEFPFVAGVWGNPLAGTLIHKIDEADALYLSNLFVPLAAQLNLPLPFWMACVGVESVFDKSCQNGNFSYLTHVGSNPTKDPAGFDMGLCQLKIKYIMAAETFSVAEAYSFALNASQALPYMGNEMNRLLTFADKLINANRGNSHILPAYQNRFLVATCAYNFGETGMTALFPKSTSIPAHGQQVTSMEKTFASSLGLPSVFADISG